MNLMAALTQVAAPPCTKYSCPHQRRCSEQLLACKAFNLYVLKGISIPPRTFFKGDVPQTNGHKYILALDPVPTNTIFKELP